MPTVYAICALCIHKAMACDEELSRLKYTGEKPLRYQIYHFN